MNYFKFVVVIHQELTWFHVCVTCMYRRSEENESPEPSKNAIHIVQFVSYLEINQ